MVCHDPNWKNLYFNTNVCYLPERPAQLDRDLVSRKLNSVYRPVLALNSQALLNTENVDIVLYIALFVYGHLNQSSWLEDWWFMIQEEGVQSLSNDQAIDP